MLYAKNRLKKIFESRKKTWRVYFYKSHIRLMNNAVYSIYIPFNVISSKNSKRIVRKGDGSPMVIKSKAALLYEKKTSIFWDKERAEVVKIISTLPKPYFFAFEFIRTTAATFDYINMAQLPLDLMQTHRLISNDDIHNVVPLFLPTKQDKKGAGLNIYFGTKENILELTKKKWLPQTKIY